MENKINYIFGDATIASKNTIIAHVCNDIGVWGAGFVLAISKKWKEPERQYKNLDERYRAVGYVQLVSVDNENKIIVANMIGQNNTHKNVFGVPPINYAAIKICLEKVFDFAVKYKFSVQMPRIGCGLAGGDWFIIETIINNLLNERIYNDLKVTVYDFK